MQRSSDVLSASKSFAALLLPPHVQQALRDAGFRRPSPVQEAALPLARLGADLIVQAKAGTGKTLVFAAAAVERVDVANGAPQVLVLAPTREIALQASEAVALCAAALPPPGLACGSFIGGLPVEEDEKQLRRACHVAVGTTGRILSLIQRGALKTGAVRMLVLDEADKLLADSFRKDVLAIIEAVPPKRQLLALSATYAPVALQQLRGLMGGRQQEVLLCCEDTSLLAVRQCYRMLPPSGAADEATAAGQASSAQQAAAAAEGSFGPHFEARLAALLNLLSSVSFQQAVVFCKYKTDAEEVAERLLAAGYPAAHLSAQRTQLQRIEALNAMRDFRLRVAVTTDLVARGVDLDRVNLVVNLELPVDAATYMHRVGRAGRFGTRGLAVSLLEGPEQLARLEGYLQEVAGGQVTELPDEVPEDWYLHAAQLAQQGQPVAATEASAAVGMGPATPAASGSSPLAAAGSWGEGGTGLLADIATASLWGEAEGEAGALLEPLPPPALPPPSPQQQQQQQEAEDAGIDLSYTVTPKPPAGTPVAVAAVAAGSGGAAGAAAAAGSLKGGSPATSPTSGKPLVSSLTAAVAAASSKASMAINVAAVASSDPVAVSQGNGNGNSHRYGDAAGCSSADSVDSWQSTSDDDYSSASSEDDATAAALAGGAPPPASFKPLRRVGSASSGSSAGSARSGGSSGGSSSGSSGRQASRPAPIPGRPQPAEQQLAGSYEGRSGGGLAEVASQASLGSLGSSEAAATAARVLGTSQEEEPSFRDSWLVEGEAQVEQSTAEQQRRLRLQRQAEAAAAAAAPTVDLKPHRVRSPKAAAAQAAKAAARAKAAAAAKQAAAAQAAARQAAAQQQQRQQAQQAQQGHYWEVVRSVQQDVQGRLSGSGTSSGSAACKPAASHAAHAAAVEAGKQPVAIARAAAGGSSSEEEFEPVLPRQRRPLGSAQLVAARKRQEEVAASRAAEAAALELMAEQAAAAEAAAAQEAAAAAEAAAAQEAAAAAEAAAAQEAAAAAGSAAGADTAAAAAEQQRQWTEFWHAHYAYYGCYPGDATWQASSAADPAAAATGGQPAAAPCGVAAAAAATEAAGLLPPPPPAPPAPPPALSAAAWACATPEYAAEQAGGAAAADGSTPGSGVAGTDGGWVQVPASLLARYQQLEWEQWQRSHAEWQQLWEQYKQYWSELYAHQQAQLDAQQQLQAQQELEAQHAQQEALQAQQAQH